MEGLYFNIDNGYVEGIVRGYRNGLLTSNQYLNLTQCETLEDLKLQLSSTDYGNFLTNVSQDSLTTSVIQSMASEKLYKEFNYLRDQLSGTSKKFMDYITYSYMIDNVALMITGTIHSRDKAEILNRCHPLGWFDTLPTLSVATDLESLYETVLIDTPLAPYFQDCFDNADELDDLNIEIIRNKLYKAYLEDFIGFAKSSLPGPASDIMVQLLEFEADRRTINIALNSLQTVNSSLTSPNNNNSNNNHSRNGTTDDDVLDSSLKLQLMPSVGKCYPIATHLLAEAKDFESVRSALNQVYDYKAILDDDNGDLEDHFYRMEMELCKDAFTQQFTISTVWAWMKSKEQEIRNITWIAECIAQNQRDRITNYISVY